MKKIFILLVLALPFNYILAEDNTDLSTDKSQNNIKKKYEEILIYGIEEEILEILKDLGNTPDNSFFPLLLDRYKEASLSSTKIALVEFFSKCDNLPEDILDYLYNETKADPSNVKLHSTLVYFLGKKGAIREGLLLLERLDHYELSVKIAAADSISKMENEELYEKLLIRLKEADEDEEKYLSDDIKSKLILSFGKAESTEIAEYLRKIISSQVNDKFLIMYGMLSLARMQDHESISIIEKNLSNDEISIQEYAGYSLSQYKTNDILSILKKMLKSNRVKVRIYACQGIVLNNDISSINILLYKFKNDPSPLVKKEALASLIYLGNPGISAFKEYMKDKEYSSSNLYVISEAVAYKPDNLNVNFLLTLYDEANKKNKEIIAKNIVKGDSNILDPLLNKLLDSDDYLIRIGAITAINRVENTTLWAKVRELSANDPSENVKSIAKKYLDLKNK